MDSTEQMVSNMNYAAILRQDLGKMDRPDLLTALDLMRQILKRVNEKFDAVEAMEKQVAEEEKNAARQRDNLTPKASKYFKIVWGLCSAIGLLSGGFVGLLLAAFFGGILLYFVTMGIDGHLNSDIKRGYERQYRQEKVVPLKEKLGAMKEELQAVLNSDAVLWATSALSEDYCNIGTLDYLIDFVQSRRADSLKEAINLYEEVRHRERMEGMQQSILNSTKEQEASLRSIERNADASAREARRSAEYNKKSADYNRKIYREIHRR